MLRRKKHYLILTILLTSLFFLLILSKNFIYEDENIVYKISVIIRGKNSESWMITKEGIDQAASDMNIDISFITLSQENNIEEQEQLIKREIDDGTDALIISPAHYTMMSDVIKSAKEKVPVVLIESTIDSVKSIPYISCDNYELGRSLAEEMIQAGNYRKNIAVVNSNIGCSSVKERYNGFMDVIKESKNNCELWNIDIEDQNAVESSKKIMKEKNIDVFVTLEPSTLEIFAQGKKELFSEYGSSIKTEIYGVGSTSKIIALLEDGIINSTIVQNEFNIGYLGVQAAVDLIKGEKIEDRNIDYAIITNRNMYSDENQRLLFPFIR